MMEFGQDWTIRRIGRDWANGEMQRWTCHVFNSVLV